MMANKNINLQGRGAESIYRDSGILKKHGTKYFCVGIDTQYTLPAVCTNARRNVKSFYWYLLSCI